MIAREEREYALADSIVVLSSFARETFLSHGTPAEKLLILSLGADLETFRPTLAIVEARRRRILSGAPLRILFVGALSLQKGVWDLAAMVRQLGTQTFRFQFVGPSSSEAAPILAGLRGQVELIPKMPQAMLPQVYAQADVFVFPTIQDGYAMVLAQAAASALPILTTTNSAGPELVRQDETGWIVPIRSPDLLADQLRWCADHRPDLAEMVERIYTRFQPRDWSDVAADFEALSSHQASQSTLERHSCKAFAGLP
jgi:glycosyltransferase involved in cell wall biosynthesis